jgi:hypothetical protein
LARDGSGNYTLPANTQAVSGDPISSTKFNTLVQDLEADANVDRPIAAGGTGASTALAARANLGLEIGVNVQAFDAGLLSIAGLTTLADRSIYTTASDTYAVYTLTAAGRAILDDADASAQRTTLGLGTAAVVNTGTSGATIPLLNAANTFSATQTLSGAGLKWATTSTTSADPGFHMTNSSARLDRILNTSTGLYIGVDATGTERTLTLSTAGVLAVGGNTVWHAGNDGAGSTLDADTVDGIQASAFATLSGSTFTGAVSLSYAAPVLRLIGTSSNIASLELHNATRYDDIRNTTAGLEFRVDTSGTPKSMLFNTAGGLQVRVAASTETTGTLTVASANETIQATGDITIPNAVFSAGDIILIYAGASSRTITQGSSVTMRLGGTATTGSRTLAARGVAMLFFVSSSEVIVSGGAVT